MTSASDRTDDRIIVSPAEDDEDVADARVIHGSIVHDDEQDEAGPDDERAGYEPLHAGQTGDDEAGDDEAGDEPPWRMRSGDEQTPEESVPGAEPRRAWIPEAPAPGAGGLGQPIAARSVPAQRAPFEAEPAEPDDPDADESSAELPEPDPSVPDPSVPGQTVLGQTTASQSVPGQPAADPTDQADQADLDEPELDEPELDELEPIEPVTSPSASVGSTGGLGTATSAVVPPASDGPWPGIQSMFVDDPRRAVEQAARVTSTALADLITAAKEVERTLGNDWKPERTGTEELRVALRGYRDLGARIATLTRQFQRS